MVITLGTFSKQENGTFTGTLRTLNVSAAISIAMTHAGSVLVKAGMFCGRMRRRFTTAPAASSPTRLQLFLPRSIPRTATLTAMSLVPPYA